MGLFLALALAAPAPARADALSGDTVSGDAVPDGAQHTGAQPAPILSRDADTLIINVMGDVAYPNTGAGIDQVDARKHELFAQVQPILDTADLNFANIECPLTDAAPVADKTYAFTCEPARLDYKTDAGLNLFSLANNHSMDAGGRGITDTLELLTRKREQGLPLWWAGTGETAEEARQHVVITLPGKNMRVAFFAVANTSAQSRVASLHDPTLPERIAAARAEADIVIVSSHFGPEYVHVPWRGAVTRYQQLIDAGADVVAAHHAHVVQGVERYKNGFIFYNLGNFSFGSRTRRHLVTGARMYSMIGRLTFHRGALARVELVPLYANNAWKWTLDELTLEPQHAAPQLLAGAFAHAALDELEDFTRSVPTSSETRLLRVGDRALVDLGRGEPGPAELAEHLHQQRHEYDVVLAAGVGPRPATAAEQQVEGRGGTPDALVREAQRKAAQEARAKKRQRGKAGTRGKAAAQRGKQAPKGKASPKGKAAQRGKPGVPARKAR